MHSPAWYIICRTSDKSDNQSIQNSGIRAATAATTAATRAATEMADRKIKRLFSVLYDSFCDNNYVNYIS